MKYEKYESEKDRPRTRRAFRLSPEVLEMVERRKASGEYETYSDFIEDAIVFYNGVLDANENRAFLGDEIIKAMRVIVKDMEGRNAIQSTAVHIYSRAENGYLLFYTITDFLVFFTIASVTARKRGI